MSTVSTAAIGSRYDINRQSATAVPRSSYRVHSEVDFLNVFYEKLRRWRNETSSTSSIDELIEHECFQDIVKMGEKVAPFILSEIRAEPGMLVAALHFIFNENPVPPEHNGNVEEMINCWMSWANRRGIYPE